MSEALTPIAPHEPTLAELLLMLWADRRSILRGGLIGLLAAILFLLLAVPHYRAAMLVEPTTRAGTADLSAPMAERASFASEYMLKGFSAGDTDDFAWFEHILKEPSVAAQLLRDPAIQQGVENDRLFRIEWRRAPATAEDLAAYLDEHVSIDPVGATAIRRIAYASPDPAFAVLLLRKLYNATDSLIRNDMRDKADRRIAWLQQMIQATQNPDDRRALAALLSDQQQIRMMMSLDEPYAARIAEPPAAGDRPAWPRKVFVLPVFVFCGLLLGAVLPALRRSLRAA
jgi:hypothetical protein